MGIWKTRIDPHSKEFKSNSNFMKSLIKEWRENLDKVRQVKGKENHFSKPLNLKRKKKHVRERIESLIDKGSYFLELSPFAAWNMYKDEISSAGIVTGIGMIQKRECMIIANNWQVKGGTYFPLTVKKHLRAQEIAHENRLPCIYLVDSGGAYLPMQSQVFPDREHFGRIFYNQARMSLDGIPQISAVLGNCTAGGAYVPSMSEENIIVRDQGYIFLGGPPLVKAATGENVSEEELGGARVHSEQSGLTDHIVDNEEEAFTKIRNIILFLKKEKKFKLQRKEIKEPLYPMDEVYGILPRDSKQFYDVREIIARIFDGSEFYEFKEKYSPSLVTGFSHLWGYPVGIVANNGVLFSESALKGAHFIELCNQRQIPLIFLQNITGFMVGKKYEQEGIAKHGAKMVMAVSNSQVPKFTLIIGGSYGAGNYGMCGRAFQPRLLWMWPHSRVSVMGGREASQVLFEVKQKQRLREALRPMSKEEEQSFKSPVLKKYAEESSAYYSSARLWDDGIIDPLETRKYLSLGITMCLNRGLERADSVSESGVSHDKRSQGVFRM